MNKGFLVTDAPGNVVYIPIQSKTAYEIARDINQAHKEVVVINANGKTVQRHTINKYISAKTEEEFLEGITIKL